MYTLTYTQYLLILSYMHMDIDVDVANVHTETIPFILPGEHIMLLTHQHM